MTKKKTPLGYLDVLRRLRQAGVENSPEINKPRRKTDELPTLEERVKKILGITQRTNRPAGNMIFFVMYDIESNKVRYNVVRYLERMGCMRVQKSIFLADLPAEKCATIKQDLAEVQSLYDNHDSIIVCPISTDLLKSMKVIGKDISLDVITRSKSTLFF